MLKKKSSGKKRQKIKTKDKLRYGTKEYVNPFFRERKLKRNRSNLHFSSRFKIYSILSALVLFLLFVYFVYGPYFEIKNIILEGRGNIDKKTLEEITRGQINDNYFILYPQKNIFLFRVNKLKDNLAKKYAFSVLNIDRKLPDTINIYYEEKAYAAIFSENEEYYYIDSAGGIITAADLLEISERDYPIIINDSSSKIFDNQAPINTDNLVFILDVFKKIKELNDDYQIERFILGDEENTIRLKLKDGPVLIFNTQTELSNQIEKLIIIKAEKLQGIFNTKEYIDLRYGSSVYYR